MKIKDDTSTITVIDDVGKEIKCTILFTFSLEEPENSYIVYTDNTTDDAGRTKVYASIYDPTGESTALRTVDTGDKAWRHINSTLISMQEEIRRLDMEKS